MFPNPLLRLQVDIGHVGQHNVRQPLQVSLTPVQAGPQEQRVPTVSWSEPGHQRNQQYALLIGMEPEPEGMLFIADKPTAVPMFARATAQRGADSRITPVPFFYMRWLTLADRLNQ